MTYEINKKIFYDFWDKLVDKVEKLFIKIEKSRSRVVLKSDRDSQNRNWIGSCREVPEDSNP